MPIGDLSMHISNVFTSNVSSANNIFSIRDNKGSQSNSIFQRDLQSSADTVSISSGAKDLFFEPQNASNKKEYEPEYDSDGILIEEEIVYNDSHLSLNEAVYNRVVNADPWKHHVSEEDLATWSPQNRELYETLSQQLSEDIQRGPGLDTQKTQEKLQILATYGGSRPMSEGILRSAVDAYDKGLDEFFEKNPDRVIGGPGTYGDGALMSQLFPDKDEEDAEEKLKKLEGEFIDQISSPSGSATNKTNVDGAQQDGSKNTSPEASDDLNKAKMAAQQATEVYNNAERREMRHMDHGLKHYEKASAFI